jgi:hypothetical protein
VAKINGSSHVPRKVVEELRARIALLRAQRTLARARLPLAAAFGFAAGVILLALALRWQGVI